MRSWQNVKSSPADLISISGAELTGLLYQNQKASERLYVTCFPFRSHAILELRFQLLRNRRELLQRRLHVVGNLLGKQIGLGQIIGLFETLVSQPENVEIYLVALQ